MTINLISDTVTKPTPAMLNAMFKAEVGDDVFGEDPTINALEQKVAAMFGKEAALFCPSGTMCNQIAIKVHTNPLDELICDEFSHVYQYETAGYAYNSGVGINLIQGENGKFTLDQLKSAVKPVFDWLPLSRLVVIENSANKGGGSYYNNEEIAPISYFCRNNGLKLHLDGARIFNVLVETEQDTLSVGKLFDSVSICLSKGLGAPVGSVLSGDAEFIRKARRVRKVMGGGMRQAGYLAAAGIFALDHHVDRLKEDNQRARKLGDVLSRADYVESVRPVKTNIVIFDLKAPLQADTFLAKLEGFGIKAVPFGPATVRFVTHLDFTEKMLEEVVDVLGKLKFNNISTP